MDPVGNSSRKFKINDNHLFKKYFKFQRPSIIKYIGNKQISDKSEINFLNRKRVIQMLDLFNSKYDCKKCRKKLRYKADQIVHEKLKHSMSNKFIKCPECDLEFNTYFSLTSHLMTVHLNERPYGCKLCHKKFHAFALLRRHCHKKHLNIKSSPFISIKSNLSVDSYKITPSENLVKSEKRNNLYDLIDYENSILITNKINKVIPISYRSSDSPSSLLSSTSSTNSAYLQLSINNPLSINSDTNMKYFNYIKRVRKSKPMDLEPIIQYINEEKLLEKQLNDNMDDSIVFTISTQIAFAKCTLCLKKFTTNSEYLYHIWYSHLNATNLNFGNSTNKFLPDVSYNQLNLNNFFHMINNKTCWTCATTISKGSFNNISFNTKDMLVAHCQEHLDETNLFMCMICPKLGFNDLDAVKNHYLNFHLEKSENEKNTIFEFVCTRCEKTYLDHNSILEHFELNSMCNLYGSKYTKIKCQQCHLEFNNNKSLFMHLSQHRYLEIVKKSINVDQVKSNNIKNSNNNKQYSIEALVNSPIKMAKKNKLEEIASKISLKQNVLYPPIQSPMSIFHQTVLASLMNLSNQSELLKMKKDEINFAQNISSIINNFNKSKSNFSEINHHLNYTKQQVQPNLSAIPNFSTMLGKPEMPTKSLLDSYDNQQQHLNSLSLSFYADSLRNSFQTTYCRNNPLQYFSNKYKTSDQRISNQVNDISPSLLPLNRYQSEDKSFETSLLGLKCEYCGYSFKTIRELVEHSSQHVSPNQKRPLRCHLCSIKFAKAEQLIKHMIVHKDNGTDPICCICHATFGRKQDLDRHMIFHSK